MTAPSTPPGNDVPDHVESFLRAILRSQLLEPEQLKAAVQAAPVAVRSDADALADHFVRTGKLSRYQSRKLLSGRWRGLFVGPYQVLGPIGKGGSGKVYLARDRRAGGLVALKVLSPQRAKVRQRLVARFRREMEICQGITHPDLARTFEVGKDGSVYYIAMEYFPGRSLTRVVTSEGPMMPDRAARLMAEVAEAIDHAHRQGIIHRDLKPGNVQVTPDDHAKVLDFGLALVLGEEDKDAILLGGPRRIVGTMDYIAPEQTADPTRVDARSDVYSLGCTLYFVLSGQPPFPGGSSLDKVRRQRSEEPVPLRTLINGVPTTLLEMVARMMAKDPALRPQTAAEVAAALRREAGIPGPPATDERRPGPPHPTISPWWLAVMLGVCGLAGGAAWYCLSH